MHPINRSRLLQRRHDRGDHQQEAFPKAKSAAQEAIEINPDLAAAHTSLAFVLSNDEPEKDLDEAERRYRLALELNPNYANAHHWYSTSLDETDRSAQALQQAKRAAQLDPFSPITLTNLGTMHVQRDDYERARELYRRALEIDPDFVNARINLAALNAEQKDFDSVVAKLKSLVENRPTNVQTRLNCASSLMAIWQWEAAQQDYLRAVDIDANSTWRAQAHINYGTFLHTAGQFDASVRHIGHAHEYQTPSELQDHLEVIELIWNGNRLLYGERNRAPKTLENAEESLESIDEQDQQQIKNLKLSLIGTRGLIYVQLGKSERAREIVDQLIERKEQVGLPYIVAQIYVELGETDKGLEWLDVGYTRHGFTLGSLA